MRVSFHCFTTDKANGGALYFYSEATRLLSNLDGSIASPAPHDIHAVLEAGRPSEITRHLDEGDVLVSNIGPYAHLYHYLREVQGGRFRIVRDVRTSSWAGFLLQEQLAGPLTRPGDLVVFPSEFCRQYFMRRFPTFLNGSNTAVSYPMTSSFPSLARRAHCGTRRSRIGYIGRFEDDKNFGQVLDAFAIIFSKDRCASLHLAGAVNPFSQFNSLRAIKRYLAGKAVPPNKIHYYGQLRYSEIWRFFSEIDVLLFLAVSSVESLGRVMLEGQHAGVPVVAAHYAAAAEVLPVGNLVAANFVSERRFDTLRSFSFGTVKLEDVAAAVECAQVGDRCSEELPYQPTTYLAYVTGSRNPDKPGELSQPTRTFIDAVRLTGDGPVLDANGSLSLLERLFRHYREYTDNRLWPRVRCHAKWLVKPPGHALQRTLHLQRLIAPEGRFEAVHAREHCWAAGYVPQIELASDVLRGDRACDAVMTQFGSGRVLDGLGVPEEGSRCQI